jgi:hypothetical protein
VLSGWIFQLAGLEACLLISTLLLFASALTARLLPLASSALRPAS